MNPPFCPPPFVPGFHFGTWDEITSRLRSIPRVLSLSPRRPRHSRNLLRFLCELTIWGLGSEEPPPLLWGKAHERVPRRRTRNDFARSARGSWYPVHRGSSGFSPGEVHGIVDPANRDLSRICNVSRLIRPSRV